MPIISFAILLLGVAADQKYRAVVCEQREDLVKNHTSNICHACIGDRQYQFIVRLTTKRAKHLQRFISVKPNNFQFHASPLLYISRTTG
ncbi:MAG: hypothetical protein N2235_25020 [Fischerella sp.]|nr:hypothetical protein [Fischerella sp.]